MFLIKIKLLQVRIQHKDASIKQYQKILDEINKHFEREMSELIESYHTESQRNTVSLQKITDNEELQSALRNCVEELEK